MAFLIFLAAAAGTGIVAANFDGRSRLGFRPCFRFGVRFHNLGPDALVIGDPGCPVCVTNPGAVCQDPRFICSPADGHNHPHLIGFADYELLDFKGNMLRQGGKKSFCVRDNRCDSGTPFFTCNNQGISPMCVDDYDPSLGWFSAKRIVPPYWPPLSHWCGGVYGLSGKRCCTGGRWQPARPRLPRRSSRSAGGADSKNIM